MDFPSQCICIACWIGIILVNVTQNDNICSIYGTVILTIVVLQRYYGMQHIWYRTILTTYCATK